MSNKPLKHSELKKKMEKQSRKEAARLVKPERFYLFCEGTKTEPNYFHGIKTKIKEKYGKMMEDRMQIQVKGTGRSTESLLKYAEKEIVGQKRKGHYFDHIWLIYDKDDFVDFDDMENKVTTLSEGSDIEWHVGWSNQCIELWFLLHFNYYNSNLHRNDYMKKLNKIFKKNGLIKYEKNRSDIFNILCEYGSLEQAIKNAKKLYDSYGNNIPLSKKAPATRVYELVEILKPHIEI